MIRTLNSSDVSPQLDDHIYVGVDFNVGNCATVHAVRRGADFHIFHEAVFRDTQQIASGLAEMYPHHFRDRRLTLLPDASGGSRSTVAGAAESDIGILKRAGHHVSAPSKNPPIRDRINAVNVLISRRQLKVRSNCTHLIKTLEQHSFDDKGMPEKGGVGMKDLSHMGDALGYLVFRLAGIRSYTTGNAKFLLYGRP